MQNKTRVFIAVGEYRFFISIFRIEFKKKIVKVFDEMGNEYGEYVIQYFPERAPYF